MNILVTGCAGYLGSRLIAALECRGHQVFGVDLFATDRALDETVDLAVEGAAADLMKGIEVVVHTAAIHPWKQYTDGEYLDNNVKPVHYVLQSAAQAGVRRVVYTSSIAAIGYHPALAALPLKETEPACPGELYGTTKWFGEVFCQVVSRNTGLETVCLRPPAFMPKPEIDRGLGLLGLWADVSDVVSAHVAAVAAPMPSSHEAFWATNPLPYTAADAAELRSDPAAVVERYWPGVPDWFAHRGKAIQPISVFWDLSNSRDILGWEPSYSFDLWWKEHAHEL